MDNTKISTSCDWWDWLCYIIIGLIIVIFIAGVVVVFILVQKPELHAFIFQLDSLDTHWNNTNMIITLALSVYNKELVKFDSLLLEIISK